ncbi:hypothetical protein EVAR_88859_1 [Eumeta japonica]|uniref:Uncharacterized protein n=1 Tax=Eumeta variegata TaxID=151549 RepID=A0A4C1Y708_EUMVA|nr:hypothetical protein EVAR_88859_1 [Eumeta japonica]
MRILVRRAAVAQWLRPLPSNEKVSRSILTAGESIDEYFYSYESTRTPVMPSVTMDVSGPGQCAGAKLPKRVFRYEIERFWKYVRLSGVMLTTGHNTLPLNGRSTKQVFIRNQSIPTRVGGLVKFDSKTATVSGGMWARSIFIAYSSTHQSARQLASQRPPRRTPTL